MWFQASSLHHIYLNYYGKGNSFIYLFIYLKSYFELSTQKTYIACKKVHGRGTVSKPICEASQFLSLCFHRTCIPNFTYNLILHMVNLITPCWILWGFTGHPHYQYSMGTHFPLSFIHVLHRDMRDSAKLP